jgi:hypothetical protein
MFDENIFEAMERLAVQLADHPEYVWAMDHIYRFAWLVEARQKPDGTVMIEPSHAEAAVFSVGFIYLDELMEEANARRMYRLSAFLATLHQLAIFFDYRSVPVPHANDRESIVVTDIRDLTNVSLEGA